MMTRSALWNRFATSVGLLCLATTLALLPAGVRTVWAEPEGESLVSVDPLLEASETATAEQPPAAPVDKPVVDSEDLRRPGLSSVQTRSGVVVLNTRGYNYGPPSSTRDIEAIRQEFETR